MPRNVLTLKNKLELIQCFEQEKLSVKQIRERFKCGKTQVYQTIKKKDEIMRELERGLSVYSKRKTPSCGYEDLNKLVWEWFVETRSRNIPLSGVMVQEKAREFAVALGKPDFKASNGWLECFKIRHSVVWSSVPSELYNVKVEKDKEWKGFIQRRIKGYKQRDVYCGDETGILFRALPSKTSSLKGEKCKGGKHLKDQLTLFICGNMAGELVKPMVIGKSARPQCFKNIDVEKLPVTWRSDKKAWNSASIMEEWLKSFNAEMEKKERKVILFLGRAAFHPKIHLSNVELVWLPVNTTSIMLPMGQGVMRSLRTLYRKHMMRSVLAAMDTTNSVLKEIEKISELNAINWINLALKDIKTSTVKTCFAKAGFLPSLIPEAESMNYLNELQEIIGYNFDAERLVTFDNNLQTCDENDIQANDLEEALDSEADEEAKQMLKSVGNKTSYKKMLEGLKDLADCSLRRGNTDLWNLLNGAISNVEDCIIQERTEKLTKMVE